MGTHWIHSWKQWTKFWCFLAELAYKENQMEPLQWKLNWQLFIQYLPTVSRNQLCPVNHSTITSINLILSTVIHSWKMLTRQAEKFPLLVLITKKKRVQTSNNGSMLSLHGSSCSPWVSYKVVSVTIRKFLKKMGILENQTNCNWKWK